MNAASCSSPSPEPAPLARCWLIRALHRAAWWLGAGTTLALCGVLILLFVARAAIRPAPGAWATTVHVGPVPVEVGVASLVWLATTPWVAE